ncbi:MAG: hypothetical protein Ct9H300mP1_26110 [Planctomycetaceae bacterium]|nr:MAG: hypothetical protein Ct9H300mP1_26110 [Planctomycetaceae bacterium]
MVGMVNLLPESLFFSLLTAPSHTGTILATPIVFFRIPQPSESTQLVRFAQTESAFAIHPTPNSREKTPTRVDAAPCEPKMATGRELVD